MAATRRLARLQGHLAGRAAVSPTGSAAQGAESIKLVVADGFFAPQAETDVKGTFAGLRRDFPQVDVVVVTEEEGDDALAEALREADAVVGIPPPQAFAAGPRIRWVHHPVSGFALAADHPLMTSDAVLTNAPGAHVPAMADWVLAMMLSWAQRMEEHFNNMRAKRWAPTDFVRYEEDYWGVEELQDTTVGIVGMGGLGEAIAQRCLGFGCRVIGLARTPRPQAEADELGIEAVWGPSQLEELLPQTDWLVVTCPLTDETRGMIGEAQLRLMKPSARIIVLSRGAIVSEAALIVALEEGRLRGAAFDSFCGEELAEDYPDSEMIGDGATPCLPSPKPSCPAGPLALTCSPPLPSPRAIGLLALSEWRCGCRRAGQLLPARLPAVVPSGRDNHAAHLRRLAAAQCTPR